MTTIESVISASDLKEFNIPITELAKEQFKTQVQDKYIEAVECRIGFPTYLILRHLGFLIHKSAHRRRMNWFTMV